MHFLSGNRVQLLRNGVAFFPALEAAIDGAKFDIAIQTYIYEADATGQRISEALIRAAQRGVHVRLMFDGFGSYAFPEEAILRLTQAGVQVMIFRKFKPWSWRRWRIRRLHRKVAVMDAEIAFVGGINIIDDQNVPHQAPPRVDYAVKVEGPLVSEIAASVHRFWRRQTWTLLTPILPFTAPHPASRRPGDTKAAFVIRNTIQHRQDIERAYLEAIHNAKHDIFIANAYFFPGRRFRQALIDAAERGVRVTLLLQGRMEFAWMQATHTFYPELLAAKIRIFEYRKSFMHSKVAVIDSHWATVGSSNIDPLSLMLAYEANVVVLDKAFAEELKMDIEKAIADGGFELTVTKWNQEQTWGRRCLKWLGYGVLRFMVSFVRRDF